MSRKKDVDQKNVCSFETGIGFRLHHRLLTDEPDRNDSLRDNGFRQELVLEAPQKFVSRSLRPLPPNTVEAAIIIADNVINRLLLSKSVVPKHSI